MVTRLKFNLRSSTIPCICCLFSRLLLDPFVPCSGILGRSTWEVEALMVRAFFSTGLYGCLPPAICVRAHLPVWVGKAGGTCVHRDRFGIDKEEQSRLRQSWYTVVYTGVHTVPQSKSLQILISIQIRCRMSIPGIPPAFTI